MEYNPGNSMHVKVMTFEHEVYKLLCNGFPLMHSKKSRQMIMPSCLQPIAVVLVAIIVCPLASDVILVVVYALRLLWDSLTFHLFIKKCCCVAVSDSIAVRRIAGPGLALDYYFMIRSEQALAAFAAQMELDDFCELDFCSRKKTFRNSWKHALDPFQHNYLKMVPYLSLNREAQDLMITLHEKLEKRTRELQTSLTTQLKTRTKELKISYSIDLSISEEEFWHNKVLAVNDWPAGLAGLIYTEIFSFGFLISLTENDTHFKLEPHPSLDMTRCSEMIQNAIVMLLVPKA
uniref:Uncharacterized protein n=1 Tax=Glossina austeni TaxID=7395 RepID=A0A1A9V1X0_GLOAU